MEEGCIFESSTPDQTYTSFSGYLVAPSGSWGESEGPPAPPGVLQAAPQHFTGMTGREWYGWGRGGAV